jgi:thiol-disulfide isomerase/thioredoxin
MIRGFIQAATLFGIVLLSAGAALSVDSREAAPRFTAKTLNGEKLTNETLQGRVVLLQFWTTWCRYCRADEDAVNTIAKEFAGKGLEVIAVNVGESKKKVARYLADSPRYCKIVLTEDTNLPAVFAANSYPMYVLIDRQGKVVARKNGAGGEGALRRLLSQAGLDPD